MTAPVTTEALVERKALRKTILAAIPANVPLRGRYATAIMEQAVGPALDAAEASLQRVTAERDEARAENDRFRAGLANGSGPCAYCNLSREDWAKCRSGFPGCGRADDAILCPHFGAEMEANDRADTAAAEAARLRGEVEAELEACARHCEGYAALNAEEATARGMALGRPRAGQDEKCSAMWATHHAANEIAGFIRSRIAARTALARAATEEGQADG